MNKIELMLEAESRGLLTPEKQALLDEAKKRGLVDGSRKQRKSAFPAGNVALNALTFGHADELGGLGAYVGSRAAGADHDKAYANASNFIDDERLIQREFRDEHPWLSAGIEIGGSVMSGSPIAAGAKTVPSMLARTTAEGVLAGEGYADDNKLGGATLGGLLGFGLAGLVPGMLAVGKRGSSLINENVIDPLMSRLSSSPDTAAQRVMQDALQNVPMEEVMRRQSEMGPLATFSDIGGPEVQYLAQGVLKNSPSSVAKARELADMRRVTAGDRLQTVVQRITGYKDRLLTVLDELKARQKSQSQDAYQLAYKAEIVPDEELVSIMNRPSVRGSVQKALMDAKDAGRELPSLDAIVMKGDDFTFTKETIPDMESLDIVKRYLDKRVNSAYRNGAPEAESLKLARNALRDKLDKLNPDYKPARNVFAGDAALEEALLSGEKFLNQTTRQVNEAVRGLSKSEKEAYLTGAVEAIRERLGRSRSGEIGQFKFLENDVAKEKLGLILPKQSQVNELILTLKRERAFAETEGMLVRNSQTSFRDAAGQALETSAMMPGSIEAITSPGRSAINASLAALSKSMRGHKPETYDKLGDWLFTPNNADEVYGLLNQPSVAPEKLRQIFDRYSKVGAYAAPVGGLLGGHIAQ